MLRDVDKGFPDFEAIVLYDFERWGWFQGRDESGSYEGGTAIGGRGSACIRWFPIWSKPSHQSASIQTRPATGDRSAREAMMRRELPQGTNGDRKSIAALGSVCDLVRPWNDPLNGIGRARVDAPLGIFVAVFWGGCGIAGSVMAGHDGRGGLGRQRRVRAGAQHAGFEERLMRLAEAWLRELGAPMGNLMISAEKWAARRCFEGRCYEIGKRKIMGRWKCAKVTDGAQRSPQGWRPEARPPP